MCRGAVPAETASSPKGICMYMYVYMRESERERARARARERESFIEGQEVGFRVRHQGFGLKGWGIESLVFRVSGFGFVQG